MSPKKKKNVPSATEQKPENARSAEEAEPKPEPVQVAPQKEAATADAKEAPQKLIQIPPIDEDTKRMLAKAGVNWDSLTQAFEKVNIWAESVDARFSVILQRMPTEKGIADELVKRSIEERQKQAGPGSAVSSGNVGGGGGGLGQVMNILDKVLGASGGGSSEMQTKIMDMAIESMGLGNALVKAIILKTAPELASQLLPPLGAAKA